MSPRLSARQEECLKLTAFLTDKEIAVRLGLSEATVKKHVHEACRRLGVNRRKAALAILERNVPGATKDPIGGDPATASADPTVTELSHGEAEQATSPLDLGGSGIGSRRVQPDRPGQSAAGLSDARPGRGRRAGQPSGTAEAGAERGLGDGADGNPGRQFGYVPPPRGWGVRIVILLLATVLGAVMLKAVADLMLAYTHQASEIDRVTQARG